MSIASAISPFSQGINPVSLPDYGIATNFAYLSNVLDQSDVNIDYIVYLDKIDLSEIEFLGMFYNTSGLAFGVNPYLPNFFPLSLIEHKYTTTSDMKVLYSLFDQILKAYSNKFNRPVNTISNNVKIHLQKDLFKVQSIVNNYAYQSALGFDELISGLISAGKIEPSSDVDSSVNVIFQLEYVYVTNLNVTVSVVFSYNVPLCGYVAKINDPCPPYSKSEILSASEKMAKDLKSAFKKVSRGNLDDDASALTFDTKALLDDESDGSSSDDETVSNKTW